MVHVDTNTIIRTRIIVTSRKKIPHKTFIKKEELAIGMLSSRSFSMKQN